MKTQEREVGRATIRLAETRTGFAGIVLLNGAIKAKLEDQNSERLWERLHQEAGRLNPHFVGYEGARSRFLRIFPGGFTSAVYLGDDKIGERSYKVKAKNKLDETVPLEQAPEATGVGEAILNVYQATNLFSPFEKMRVRDALRSPRADAFVHGAAEFTLGDRNRGLAAMAHVLKPHDAAKWTTMTYLPFLWRPETHMFLKPDVTRRFAARVGHRFEHEYSATADTGVYDSLLDLIAETRAELTPLGPRDNIDIQSFIWVVGEYSVEDEQGVGARVEKAP